MDITFNITLLKEEWVKYGTLKGSDSFNLEHEYLLIFHNKFTVFNMLLWLRFLAKGLQFGFILLFNFLKGSVSTEVLTN